MLTVRKVTSTSKYLRNPWFLPTWIPHQKKCQLFLIIIAEVRYSYTFSMQKVYFQRVSFRLCSLLNEWMDGTMICSLREKRFFSHKWRYHDVKTGRELSQNARCCLTDPAIPSVTFYLNQFRNYVRSNVYRPLWLPARALKGRKYCKIFFLKSVSFSFSI